MIDGKTLLHVTGELPVFAAAAQPEAAPLAEAGESVDGGPRISKFTGKTKAARSVPDCGPNPRLVTIASPSVSPLSEWATASGDRSVVMTTPGLTARSSSVRGMRTRPRASRLPGSRPGELRKAQRLTARRVRLRRGLSLRVRHRAATLPTGLSAPQAMATSRALLLAGKASASLLPLETIVRAVMTIPARARRFLSPALSGASVKEPLVAPALARAVRPGASSARVRTREVKAPPGRLAAGSSGPARTRRVLPVIFGNRSERPAGGGFKRPFSPRTSDRPAGDFAARADRQERPASGGFKRPGGYSPRPTGDFAPREQGDAPRKVYRKFDAPRDKKPFAPRSGDAPRGDRPAFGSERPRTFDRPRPGGSGSNDRSERPRSGEGRPSFGAKPFGSKPSGFAKKAASKSAFAGKGGPFAKFADGKKPFRKPGKPSGPKPGGGGFAPTRRKRARGRPMTQRARPVIAIDGPAGAGKSTVAAHLARRFGFLNLETGAMYRALALKAIDADLDLDDEACLVELCSTTKIVLEPTRDGNRVLLDGMDVTRRLRDGDVTAGASRASVHAPVRTWMVAEQRALGAAGGVVMEGRDIGTAVFPDAEVKIFLDAAPEVRGEPAFSPGGIERARGAAGDGERVDRGDEGAGRTRPDAGAIAAGARGGCDSGRFHRDVA